MVCYAMRLCLDYASCYAKVCYVCTVSCLRWGAAPYYTMLCYAISYATEYAVLYNATDAVKNAVCGYHDSSSLQSLPWLGLVLFLGTSHSSVTTLACWLDGFQQSSHPRLRHLRMLGNGKYGRSREPPEFRFGGRECDIAELEDGVWTG